VSVGPLVLASASPRRRRILELLGLPFEVVPSEIAEVPAAGESPVGFALRAARDKALEVAARSPGRTVLGADTVVEIDGEVLGKPGSAADATAMLGRLSGRGHAVHTAVCLVVDGAATALVDTASVRFARLTERTISWYVATGEPMDKAGAYAVQGLGGLFVACVCGSPSTVVGLPVHRLPELFARHGLDLWGMLEPRGLSPRPGSAHRP
jgi:septum formation protein